MVQLQKHYAEPESGWFQDFHRVENMLYDQVDSVTTCIDGRFFPYCMYSLFSYS